MAQRKEMVQYQPLADRDYGLKGFEFEGDLVVRDAMKRWAVKPEGDYLDFLRRAYWVEAQKAGGHVVDMGKGELPLTFEEVMATDPYALAVKYDEGDYSKHHRGKYGAGTQIVMGEECAVCGSHERDVKGKCHPCVLAAQHKQQEAYRLAHPEHEEKKAAALKVRQAKWAAQRKAAEDKLQAARVKWEAKRAARRVLMAEREAAKREAIALRKAAREEARIAAARVRAAESSKRQGAPNNKFEGKPCRACGSTLRYIKSKDCVACMARVSQRARERQAMSVGT